VLIVSEWLKWWMRLEKEKEKGGANFPAKATKMSSRGLVCHKGRVVKIIFSTDAYAELLALSS
jgi:hypothetical protein